MVEAAATEEEGMRMMKKEMAAVLFAHIKDECLILG